MKEIVVVLGYHAAGKTTYVEKYVSQGYKRVNRDLIGGTLDGLCSVVESSFLCGETKVVLDNTYTTIASRASIVQTAKKLGAKITCVWLNTSFEDAQFNACTRMVRKHGRLLTPAEMKSGKDPNDFPPAALFSYRKNFEKPTITEGFDVVEKVDFKRVLDPSYDNKALILDYDDTLREVVVGKDRFPTCPTHVSVLPGRKEKLQEYKDNGYMLLGVSNQSGIAKGKLTESIAKSCFDRTNELLGFDIEYHFCPHNVPPVVCFCRKPHPGHGVLLIEKYKLDASRCIFIGDATTDATFAKRCGFQYEHPNTFFK